MYAEEQGRDGLLDPHALELHFMGQPGQRVLHAVMRERQGNINIGADFEDYRDGEEAVTRRLAADIVHVFDAIDGLFERRRNSVGDRFGRSAGIGGRDLDRGGTMFGYWATGRNDRVA